MRLTNHELLKAVRFALYASATAVVGLSSAPVFAQSEAGTENLETIVVTGSRIRRVDIEGASPVFTIDKADIERSGKLTIGDLIQESPSIAGAATNPQVNNGGGTGASTVSIRGLGSQRTLLLVNGRRLAYADVNSIPISMVERIDILKDGASAIYGSDAVAGVVNFVLRKDYQGIEATVDYGLSDADDGERKGVSITLGHSSDRGNIIVGANYNKTDGIGAGDRQFSNPALLNYFGTVYTLGSSFIPTGRYTIPRTVAQTSYGINCPGTGPNVNVLRRPGTTGANPTTDYQCYGGADSYDYSPFNLVQTPQERGGLFVNGNYRITDNIEFYVEAFTNKTRSSYVIAPLPLIFGPQLTLSNDSYYNPFANPVNPVTGDPLLDADGNPLRVDISVGGIRLSALGNRVGNFTTQADQISSGLRGGFGDSWQWDAGITFARTTQDDARSGYLFGPAIAAGVGPSFLDTDGVVRCGAPNAVIENCTPINLFGLDASTPEGQAAIAAINDISVVAKGESYSTYKAAQFNLTGELFQLPAGALSVAFGGEYREDYTDIQPDFITTITDPVLATCLTSTEACRSASTGELSVREFYAEFFVPILADVPFAKSLNLTVGSRFSDYSAFGNTVNSKVGLEWRPIDDLLFRGTIAEVFRSPTISDLFGGTGSSADTYNDPCSGAGYQAGNPACAGVSPGFEQVTQQTSSVFGSNINLVPEAGKSFTWGVVYDPSWLPGLSTTVDVWRIYLTDVIGSLGTQTIIDQCYNFGTFCDLFTRDASEEIDFVSNLSENIGRLDARGVDFSIKYRLPETSYGNFRVSLDTTYFQQYDVQNLAGDITTQTNSAGTYFGNSFGGPGNLARWRGLGALSWNLGAFDASWRARYIGATRFGDQAVAGDGYSIVNPSGDPGQNSYRAGASTFHNLQFGYNIEPANTRVELGVDNVGNKQPPQLWQYGFNGNTDERTYDTVGRFYWARVGVKF